jgi:hypothetical protein
MIGVEDGGSSRRRLDGVAEMEIFATAISLL